MCMYVCSVWEGGGTGLYWAVVGNSFSIVEHWFPDRQTVETKPEFLTGRLLGRLNETIVQMWLIIININIASTTHFCF